MVRFGNVLGSSGSVVPIFQKQIENGGPITVTDPKCYKILYDYFRGGFFSNSIICFSKGEGEVFLLDMGKPMQIKKLAEQMILLKWIKY